MSYVGSGFFSESEEIRLGKAEVPIFEVKEDDDLEQRGRYALSGREW